MYKFITSGCALALGLTLGAAAIAQTVTLKVATFTPARGLMANDILDPFLAKVEADAGGDLKFERFYGGTLGRDPSQYLKLVQDGVTDIAHVVPHYIVGRFPDEDLFNLPYIVTNAEEAGIAYWRMYEKGMMRGFEGLPVVAVFATGVNTVHARTPLKSLADLKGLKLRTSGEGMTEAARLLGAVGVAVPGPAIAENISRGLIDGVLLDWTAIELFRITEVTPYHLDINLGTIPNLLVANKKAYDSMSPRAKAALQKHGGEAFARIVGRYNDNNDNTNRAKLKASDKHTVVALTASEDAGIKALLQPMHDHWRKARPEGDKVYGELQKLLAEIRAGK